MSISVAPSIVLKLCITSYGDITSLEERPGRDLVYKSILLNLSITSHGDITLSFSHNYKL